MKTHRASMVLLLVLACGGSAVIYGGGPAENGKQRDWFREGREAVDAAKRRKPIDRQARNVILFIGDGMGIATVTAARIFEGQQRGQPGEENVLSFEKFPYTALIKTYNTNQQTSDSAGTMTAMVTGVKTKAGVLSVNEQVVCGDHASTSNRNLTTILELAERKGLSTGVVTTTTVTHATPGACYAHTPERDWEDDSELPESARSTGFPDIARQLIEFSEGDGLEVVLGGGRQHFLPATVQDPEYTDKTGRRMDHRNLTDEWLEKPRAAYVWNREQFDALDVTGTDHLLGLFEPGHMRFEVERATDPAGEPSLATMTEKAIDILSRNSRGYFLMVEGGRIDHAHHRANAYRALVDTVAFADAVETAIKNTKREETLIIVTADHSHVFTLGGYATRGNPVLGKVVLNDERGNAENSPAKDALGRPYTTLTYANGPGYTGASDDQPEGPKHFVHGAKGYKGVTEGRPDLTGVDTQDRDYLYESAVPLTWETHGGEDVPLYADGPMAHLFHGVLEQHVIFHVMAEALGVSP